MERKRKFIQTVLLLAVWVLPSVSLAGEEGPIVKDGLEGEVSIGAAGVGVDNESFKFGEYTGISDSNGYFVGDMDLRYNRDAYYMDLVGEDIGLENRNVYLETGHRGDYKFFAELRELPHLLNNANRTPLDGAGNTSLSLPAGFVRSNSTGTMSITGIKDAELEIDGRRSGTFGFSKSFGKTDFNLSFMRETKDGLLSLGAATGIAGGGGSGARTIVLPEPIEQVVNEVRASLAHNGDEGQVQLDFFLSLLDNEIESISWAEPFLRSTDGTGIISRAPDNQYWKLSLSGGRNLPMATRISGIAEYGVMRQNENLLPFAAGTSPGLLPRANAEAEIHTIHVNMNVASRPTPKVGLRGKYRHYQTINETEQSLFRYMRNDAEATQAAISADEAMFNLPYDTIQDQIEVGATINVARATHLKLDYGLELLNRDFRDVERTAENSFKVGVQTNILPNAEAGYSFFYAMREETSTYDEALAFRATHTPQHIATGSTFEDVLDLRQFDIAERERTRHNFHVNIFPTENTTVGISYNYTNDDFEDTIVGTLFNRNHSATADLSVTFVEDAAFHVFYTFEAWESDQVGREHTSAGLSVDATRNWTAQHQNYVHTVGLGANLNLMRGRANVSADYSFSQSLEMISFTTGTNAAVAGAVSQPDLETTLHTLNLSGIYKYAKNIDLGLRYLFEMYQSADFATDNFLPGSTTLTAALTLSGTVPDYVAHSAIAFIKYRFGGDAE